MTPKKKKSEKKMMKSEQKELSLKRRQMSFILRVKKRTVDIIH